MVLSNKVYNFLKPTVTVVLPAVQTLYFALATIWGLPNAEQVVGTIAAVNLFLGAFVGLGSKTYNNAEGDMFVNQSEDGTTFNLALDGDPADLVNKDRVTFRVQK
jgi:hypothetical protein